MIKKILVAGLVAGAGVLGAVGFAAPASAEPVINVANNACVAPWQWVGPANILTDDNAPDYKACNGNEAPEDGVINVLENACVAPWHWVGPLNVLTEGNDPTYKACNHNG